MRWTIICVILIIIAILTAPIISRDSVLAINICDYLCVDNFSIYYMTFGAALVLFVGAIFSGKLNKSIFLLLLIDSVVYVLFPLSTDYFFPAKEDALIWINLIYPCLYLVFELVKKVKGKK